MKRSALMLVVAMTAGLVGVTAGPALALHNDNLANAEVVGAFPATINHSNTGATLETGENQPCGGMNRTLWYRFTAPAAGQMTVDTFTSNYDTVLAAYNNGTSFPLTSLACNDDYTGLQSRVQFNVTAGTTYLLQVGGYFGSQGNIVLHLTAPTPPPPPPANDNFATATSIPSTPYTSSTVNTQYATTETGETTPSCSTGGAAVTRTIWYQVTPSVPGLLTADTIGSSYDTVLAVYINGDPLNPPSIGSLREFACNDDAVGLQSRTQFLGLPGVTYWVKIGTWGTGFGNAVLHLN